MNPLQNDPISPDKVPQALTMLFAKVESIEAFIKQSFNNSTQIDDEKPLNIIQAAAFLDLQPGTLYNKVYNKEIPYNKKGRRVYFFRRDLINYLNGGRIKTTEELQDEALASLSK